MQADYRKLRTYLCACALACSNQTEERDEAKTKRDDGN